MNASALLDELLGAGIRLRRDGADLIADVLPTADLCSHMEQITAHKSALVSALHLREQIVAVLDVEREHFDRAGYLTLWARWQALDAGAAR
jgi:hypothetical protein